MKLWEITRKIESLVDDVGPEPTPTQVAEYHDLATDFEKKIDSTIAVLAAYKARGLFLEQRKKEIQASLEQNEHAERRLKDYIKWQLETHPDLDFRGETGMLRLQRGRSSIMASDDAKWSEIRFGHAFIQPPAALAHYCREEKIWSLDIERLREDLKAGAQIPGVTLQDNRHVRVGA